MAAALLAPLAILWLLPLVSDLSSILLPRLTHLARWDDAEAGLRATRARLLVLVPAHDEALLIGACVHSLLETEHEHSDAEVVVIADNCTDDTAQVATIAGARVLERHDPAHRGKPRAIEWALQQLPMAEFDAVVIVDADTCVGSNFTDALAEQRPLRNKAVQAYFGLSNPDDSWLSVLAELLASVRYEGQYLLKQKAGLNCPLTGNGMCLGTALLARAGWAPDSLTEDWELYARYTALGEVITFAPDAWLAAQEARTLAQSSTQRRRWQAGRSLVFRDYLGRIIRSDAIGWRQKIDALAELSAPGPVLHAMLAGMGAIALFVAPGWFPHVVGAAFAISLVPMVVWTIRIWWRKPDRAKVAWAFARLPAYAIWRVAVAALAIGTGRTGTWQRSPRHASGGGAQGRRAGKSPARGGSA